MCKTKCGVEYMTAELDWPRFLQDQTKFREDERAEKYSGPWNLSGAIRRRSAALQFARRNLRLGRRPRLQGGADPLLGRQAVRPRESRRVARLLRGGQGHCRPIWAQRHRALD